MEVGLDSSVERDSLSHSFPFSENDGEGERKEKDVRAISTILGEYRTALDSNDDHNYSSWDGLLEKFGSRFLSCARETGDLELVEKISGALQEKSIVGAAGLLQEKLDLLNQLDI